MIALALCALYFVVTWMLARRALWAGVSFVLLVGYSNGIVRANLSGTATQFMFDASVGALLVAALMHRIAPQRIRALHTLHGWIYLLAGWIAVLFVMPRQDLLIQLIGVRSTVFYLLGIVVGIRLSGTDIARIAGTVAVLNLLALGVGLLEQVLGVERFMPYGPTTRLIYQSTDIIINGERNFRIPSMFAHAHAYGGTMAVSFPIVMGALFNPRVGGRLKPLLIAGALAALFGAFLCGARSPVVAILMTAIYLLFVARLSPAVTGSLGLMTAVMVYFVGSSERLQRFLLLLDTQSTVERVGGSANAGFWDLLAANPFGNGLGGSGTGVPYFLENRFIASDWAMENEYARLVLDTGWIGFAIFVGFFVWCMLQRSRLAKDEWQVMRQLVWFSASFSFATAFLGIGLLIALPSALMLFIFLGWALAPPANQPVQSGKSQSTSGSTTPLPALQATARRLPPSAAPQLPS